VPSDTAKPDSNESVESGNESAAPVVTEKSD